MFRSYLVNHAKRQPIAFFLCILIFLLTGILADLGIIYEESFSAYKRELFRPLMTGYQGAVLTNDPNLGQTLKANRTVRAEETHPVLDVSELGMPELSFAYLLGIDTEKDSAYLTWMKENGIPLPGSNEIVLMTDFHEDYAPYIENGTLGIGRQTFRILDYMMPDRIDDIVYTNRLVGIVSLDTLQSVRTQRQTKEIFYVLLGALHCTDRSLGALQKTLEENRTIFVSISHGGVGMDRLFLDTGLLIRGILLFCAGLSLLTVLGAVRIKFRSERDNYLTFYRIGGPPIVLAGYFFLDVLLLYVIGQLAAFGISFGIGSLLFRGLNTLNESVVLGCYFALSGYLVGKILLIHGSICLIMGGYIVFLFSRNGLTEDRTYSKYVKKSSGWFVRGRRYLPDSAFLHMTRNRGAVLGRILLIALPIFLIGFFMTRESGDMVYYYGGPSIIVSERNDETDMKTVLPEYSAHYPDIAGRIQHAEYSYLIKDRYQTPDGRTVQIRSADPSLMSFLASDGVDITCLDRGAAILVSAGDNTPVGTAGDILTISARSTGEIRDIRDIPIGALTDHALNDLRCELPMTDIILFMSETQCDEFSQNQGDMSILIFCDPADRKTIWRTLSMDVTDGVYVDDAETYLEEFLKSDEIQFRQLSMLAVTNSVIMLLLLGTGMTLELLQREDEYHILMKLGAPFSVIRRSIALEQGMIYGCGLGLGFGLYIAYYVFLLSRAALMGFRIRYQIPILMFSLTVLLFALYIAGYQTVFLRSVRHSYQTMTGNPE